MSPELQAGLRFGWQYTIPERATVPNLYHDTAFCRDMPDVLATGYLVGMMELACTNGIMPYVDWPREQSVGTMVNFAHLAASSAGMTLDIKGEVVEVEGRRVKFHVEAWDGIDKVCEGSHERVIIDSEKFNAKVAIKKSKASL
jgi:fluoroacetyl-CoA thioesterase